MLLAALFAVGGGASLYAQSSDFFEYDGLKYEISRCPRDIQWPVNTAMDQALIRN